MNFLLILLLNLIYIPAIWFGVVNDDAMDLKLNPYNVKRRKIGSILLHLLVAEYIYLAFGQSQVSLIAALLFSIHPITIQVSCWGSGRYYGMNALIFLMALAFMPYGCLLYGLGNLPTASLLFTPLVFAFTNNWLMMFIFIPIACFSYKAIWLDNAKQKRDGGQLFVTPLPKDFKQAGLHWINLIIVVKTFGFYALKCLLPIKNGFFDSFLTRLGASKKDSDHCYSLNRHFWGGIFAMVLMAVIWWCNRFNFIGIGLMLFVTSLIPFMNFITVQQFTAPRYAYLPLIGFQVALVGILLTSAFGYMILSALWLFYLDRLIRVMPHYAKDNTTMIQLDSQVFPDNARLWYYRYEHMLNKGNPIMAWAEASYGLKHLPEDCQLWFGLACASFQLGDVSAASNFLKKAEEFMIVADRNNMQELIAEFRERINVKLQEKYTIRGKGGFNVRRF